MSLQYTLLHFWKYTLFTFGCVAMTFEVAYKTHFRFIVNLAFSILRQPEEAKDIAQDSFLALHKIGLDAFTTEKEVRGFLAITTRNNCLNLAKYKKVRRDHSKPLARSIETYTEFQEINVRVERGLLTMVYNLIPELSAQQQQVFRMIHFGGLRNLEVAEVLGVKPSTVNVQYKRAIDYLIREVRKKPL